MLSVHHLPGQRMFADSDHAQAAARSGFNSVMHRVYVEGELVQPGAALCDAHGRRRRGALHQAGDLRPHRAPTLQHFKAQSVH